MASNSAESDTISEINVVPLVDIILVVLIIFMVTAPAMIKPSIAVQLPEAASGDPGEPSVLQVAISSDGRVVINNEEVSEDRARQMAAEEFERNSEVQAVVAADQDAPYGLIVKTIDWIKSSGVKKFAITTDRKITPGDVQ